MKPHEAVDLITFGARQRSDAIPGQFLPLLQNFGSANPGIKHPLLYKVMGDIDGRRHLDNGGLIIISGDVGVGKTVTALILGLLTGLWENITMGDGTSTTRFRRPRLFYTSAPQYLDKQFEKDWKKGVPPLKDTESMLILDDFGNEFFPPGGARETKINELLDTRYRERLPTVITTNKSEAEIRGTYSEHIVSRLFDKEWSLMVVHHGDDMRR